MPVTVTTPKGMMDEMVGGWMPNRDPNLPFSVRVAVIQTRPPRDPYFEYIVDVGKLNISRALYNEPGLAVRPDTNLMFVFPERHMSVREQQMFVYGLVNHDETENIGHVDIVTSCPLILSDFRAEQVRIVTWKGDEKKYI